jgi:hypothetical protein
VSGQGLVFIRFSFIDKPMLRLHLNGFSRTPRGSIAGSTIRTTDKAPLASSLTWTVTNR